MRRLGTLFAALFLLQAAVAAAAAAPGLEVDKRFGDDGVVDFKQQIPGYRSSYPIDTAGTGTGGFFVLESAYKHDCQEEDCYDTYLVRYGKTGVRDSGFGFVPVLQGPNPYEDGNLAVDAAGRPLVYWREGKDALVVRFTSRGRVDRSFADQGMFVLHCGGCFPDSLLAMRNGKVLFLSDANERVQSRYEGSIPILVRLRRDGRLDRSFGVDGIARPRLRQRSFPDDLVVEPGGGIVFYGDACCVHGPESYVARLRADGTVDRRFGRNARRAVKRLPGSAETLFGHGLVGYRNGSVDLYGDLDFGDRTFVLKLERNGSLSRSFGSGGMKALRWHLIGVASDGRNGTIALANQSGREFAYRLGSDVRIAGAPRAPLSLGDQEGVSAEAQRGGTVLIFDRGIDSGCRQVCGPGPTMSRLRLTG